MNQAKTLHLQLITGEVVLQYRSLLHPGLHVSNDLLGKGNILLHNLHLIAQTEQVQIETRQEKTDLLTVFLYVQHGHLASQGSHTYARRYCSTGVYHLSNTGSESISPVRGFLLAIRHLLWTKTSQDNICSPRGGESTAHQRGIAYVAARQT